MSVLPQLKIHIYTEKLTSWKINSFYETINDEYGHEYGDLVLSNIGKLLKASLRAGDVCARYGGEEFVIALPQTTLEQAEKVGERIRKTVAEEMISAQGINSSVTISVGVAACIPNADVDVDTLVARADNGMYMAKDAGRNRVCTYCVVD